MTKKALTITLVASLYAAASFAQTAVTAGKPPEAACLLMVARCISKGNGNFYLYQEFSHRQIAVRRGDVLEYDEFLAPWVPQPSVSIDATFGDGTLRDSAAKDQNGLRAHADADLGRAIGKWYSRKIDLDSFAHATTRTWSVAFEGDRGGTYAVLLRNVAVRRADGSRIAIYEGGTPEVNATAMNAGYSRYVTVQAVPLSAIAKSEELSSLIAQCSARCLGQDRVDTVAESLRLIEQSLAADPAKQAAFADDVREAKTILSDVSSKKSPTAEELNEAADRAIRPLAALRPYIRQWRGHLVGHAHIDMQWLWEYPETVAEFGKTFGQAVKFMEEFPEFTFTQSSSAFYQETEASHPELFEKIKKYVKEGRWELVGGRICEGDTNIVSAESHARHFLYGQRYFQERFGKQAVVGWEPDTFGHCRQMPQIAQLGGCKYYYFCRAGNGRSHGSPLFWWKGPDGSRVLAFEEIVISGWYNDDRLDRRVFGELGEMTKRTGSKDELWVYGVGNHGGGPTRESIETAMQWMREPNLPTVKFSTAQAFFEAQTPQTLARIPVVDDELNSVFEGCYTTHGDIKRWNADCQAVMVSAETAATVAARFGFEYPGLKIRQNWEDICWNHHHDTIDGSAQHAPYKKSKAVAERVLLSGRKIGEDAVLFLTDKATTEKGDLLVFNPLGSDRDTVVECTVPAGTEYRAMQYGNDRSPLQMLDASSRRAIFCARKLPSVGYRVYRPATEDSNRPPAVSVSADGSVLENENLKVVLDAQTGTIRSLFDKRAGREVVAPGRNANRLEIHYEQPSGMPAWEIGVIDHVDRLETPVVLTVVERGPVRCTVEFSRPVLGSTVTQRVSLATGGESVLGELRIDWKETGSAHRLWPFLKLAFDLNLPAAEGAPEAWYEVPFGAVRRPADGREAPAVAWADYGTPQFAMSLICDCKHGYSAKDGTLRLSLVRTPTNPDSQSDNYLQVVHYEVFPHKETWKIAGTVQRALAFVQPLWTAWASQRGTATLPVECSFLKSADPRAVITAVKRAEDDDALVVRLYEPTGAGLNTQMSLHWPVLSGSQVNFVEEPLNRTVTATPDGLRILLDLGGAEIRTVQLHLRGDPAASPRGTRGPGPIRPF